MYLDYAGAALPTRSQLRATFQVVKISSRSISLTPTNGILDEQELESRMMGNPHSGGSVAGHTAELVDQARALTFAYFSASPQEYDVVFTSGATAAARLVGEYFPWTAGR